ncbi:hypothetical protein IHC04_005327 [Escherichia coli]|nr:hypothetical protein [Escherichia coli]EHU6059840.1 hypothetical protein [Escherichia coli]EIB8327172.1 hypothetical protein [Escherichia coli]ELU4595994.1 hypothetical protein [Escherichia coli]ELW5295729.1 hypothetical protein [Escherichia coli]
MAARDRNADLAWIRQQLVDAAWFVRATLEAHGMGVGGGTAEFGKNRTLS